MMPTGRPRNRAFLVHRAALELVALKNQQGSYIGVGPSDTPQQVETER